MKCEKCDRETCPKHATHAVSPAEWEAANADCTAHKVDWRDRATKAEADVEWLCRERDAALTTIAKVWVKAEAWASVGWRDFASPANEATATANATNECGEQMFAILEERR